MTNRYTSSLHAPNTYHYTGKWRKIYSNPLRHRLLQCKWKQFKDHTTAIWFWIDACVPTSRAGHQLFDTGAASPCSEATWKKPWQGKPLAGRRSPLQPPQPARPRSVMGGWLGAVGQLLLPKRGHGDRWVMAMQVAKSAIRQIMGGSFYFILFYLFKFLLLCIALYQIADIFLLW